MLIQLTEELKDCISNFILIGNSCVPVYLEKLGLEAD